MQVLGVCECVAAAHLHHAIRRALAHAAVGARGGRLHRGGQPVPARPAEVVLHALCEGASEGGYRGPRVAVLRPLRPAGTGSR